MTHDTKHTPGPWKIDGDSDGQIVKVVGDSKHGGLIADVSAWWYDKQTRDSNARLISAAPEMLEALQEVRDSLRDMTTEDYQHGADRVIRDRIDAVIAKATGR